MTPSEDARTLLKLVDRHICALALNLNPNYPDEEWGFTAQQAVEKLLKAKIVLADEQPPFSHVLHLLAGLAGIDLPNCLQVLQPYAVEARYEEGSGTGTLNSVIAFSGSSNEIAPRRAPRKSFAGCRHRYGGWQKPQTNFPHLVHQNPKTLIPGRSAFAINWGQPQRRLCLLAA